MADNPYDFSLDQEKDAKIQSDEQSDLLKINFVIKEGFGIDDENQNNQQKRRPKVLFQKAKNESKVNDIDENCEEREQFSKGRTIQSRQSSRDYCSYIEDSTYEISKRRVNFKRKGSINFSYSFLPGEVITRK